MVIRIKKSQEFTDILQRNLKTRCDERKRTDNTVHVSDILPTTCIRKQYYSRKFPDEDSISNEMVHHFIRGESSEFVITQLADIGVAQANIEMDGIVAHPDIMTGSRDTIVELKDTINGKRLDFYDDTFRAYLRQFDAEDVGIESWDVILPKDDIAREILKNEMIRRKNLFLRALVENNVSLLPRLIDEAKRSKCPYCQFYDKCINQDSESDEAKKMAKELDLLDIKSVVDFKSSV